MAFPKTIKTDFRLLLAFSILFFILLLSCHNPKIDIRLKCNSCNKPANFNKTVPKTVPDVKSLHENRYHILCQKCYRKEVKKIKSQSDMH